MHVSVHTTPEPARIKFEAILAHLQPYVAVQHHAGLSLFETVVAACCWVQPSVFCKPFPFSWRFL